MKNKPSKEGLYWARSRRCQWWNLIVIVDGDAPYLRIYAVRDSSDMTAKEPHDIYEFGDEIVRPQKPVLDESEKKSY